MIRIIENTQLVSLNRWIHDCSSEAFLICGDDENNGTIIVACESGTDFVWFGTDTCINYSEKELIAEFGHCFGKEIDLTISYSFHTN